MMVAKFLRRSHTQPCKKCRRRRAIISGIVTLITASGVSSVILLSMSGPTVTTMHFSYAKTAAYDSLSLDKTQQISRISQAMRPKRTITHKVVHAIASPMQAVVRSGIPKPTYSVKPTYKAASPTPTVSHTQATAVATTSSSGDLDARLLAEAMTMSGVPYVYGGDTPSGFDCSGLIYWSALQIGISNMPRDTYEMLSSGVSSGLLVPTSNPQPGDLAFFGSGHVELVTSKADYTWGAQQPGKTVGYNEYWPGSYAPSAYYYIR